MTTWRLWRALKSPPSAHPIYQRLIASGYDEVSWGLVAQNVLLQGQIWFWSLLFVLDTRALILMMFSGTFYGLIWSAIISGAIASEREYRMYDLLCLSPSGTFGISWVICAACLHRNQTFEHVNSQEAWSIRVILFVPLVISANVLVRRAFSDPGTVTIVWLLAFLLVFYLDHVQSIIFGSLFGVLAPQYTSHRFDARICACAAFLLVQTTTYLALVLTGTLLLPSLYRLLGVTGWSAELTAPILSVAVFYLLREAVLRRLWCRLTRQLNAAPVELEHMFKRIASSVT